MDHAKELSEAVELFWKTRQKQSSRNKDLNVEKQDTNGRSAVTGGAQLDGFINLVTTILKNKKEEQPSNRSKRKHPENPGYPEESTKNPHPPLTRMPSMAYPRSQEAT